MSAVLVAKTRSAGVCVLVGLAFLFITACASGDDAEAPAAAASPLVIYERTGGIAGRDDQLVISRDGRARLTTSSGKSQCRVRARAKRRLRRNLRRINFQAEQPSPKQPIPDAFTYRLTFRGAAIEFSDGTVRKRQARALSELNRIVIRCESTG